MPCLFPAEWGYSGEPCPEEPRNPYACLCASHVGQVDRLFARLFPRTPYHLMDGVRFTIAELEQQGKL